ncbi:MAG: hypothetical protein WC471_05070 [Candidatus Woesearchaeota archaeon]
MNIMRYANRIITDKDIIAKKKDFGLPKIEISSDLLLSVENIVHGALPLSGFVSENDLESIISCSRMRDGTILPIPPLFHVSKEIYDNIPNGEAILMHSGKPIGLIFIDGRFELCKERYIDNIFRTRDPEHPGVSYIQNIKPFLFYGDVALFEGESKYYGDDALTPALMKEEIKKRGWKKVSAFSTTNIPHRAHEYLQRLALEQSDGLVIHALDQIGVRKYDRQKIKDCYSALIDNYYPSERVIFSFLPILSMSAGPREVLLQAVMRHNFGITEMVVGRDHSGFKKTYGEYESQDIFQKFPDLGVVPLLFKGPYYCKKCDCLATRNTCRHDGVDIIEISGTRLREMMKNNEPIPEYYMRREVIKKLRE